MSNQTLSAMNDDTLLDHQDQLYRTSLKDTDWSNDGKKVSVGMLAAGLVGGGGVGMVAGTLGAIGLQAMDVINIPQFAGLISSPLAVSVMAAGAVVGALAGAYLLKLERSTLQSFVDENRDNLSQANGEISARPNLAARVDARRALAEQEHAELRATQAASRRDGVAGPLIVGALIGGPR